MQQSKESDESVDTVRERFSFTWRRNDFLLVFTLLEMRIVKKKRTKQKTNVKKKRFLFLFKREKNVGPTPTVPSPVCRKNEIPHFFFFYIPQTVGNDNIVDDDDDQPRRRACSLYAR